MKCSVQESLLKIKYLTKYSQRWKCRSKSERILNDSARNEISKNIVQEMKEASDFSDQMVIYPWSDHSNLAGVSSVCF